MKKICESWIRYVFTKLKLKESKTKKKEMIKISILSRMCIKKIYLPFSTQKVKKGATKYVEELLEQKNLYLNFTIPNLLVPFAVDENYTAKC
ncbi:hypothetical protein BpHYR1_029125 [Brachionus plicatilis]|uniref:Uncharacterized protein n=1 Tax=Brachionus plicatilis TaxID=10195 RepID=A0A3M7R3L9_BRAPC|nr:hypothetical protein BpHYR1_029125 [Brachionus plicatilis]